MDQVAGDGPLRELRLRAVLNERDHLRAEMLEKFQHHLQLFSLFAPAVLATVALLADNKAFDLLYVVPVVTSALAYRYVWEERVINRISDYLLDMETRKIPALIGTVDGAPLTANSASSNFWVAWEHYFHDRFPYRYHLVAAVILFVVLPIAPPVSFGVLVVVQRLTHTSTAVRSVLPIGVHLALCVLYVGLSVAIVRALKGS